MKGVFVLAVLVCCVAVISAEHFYVDREIESVELESVLRAPVPGQNTYTVSRPEGKRTYHVWVPQSYFNTSRAFGVVFAWHGLKGECEIFGLKTAAFQNYAEKYGFLYVYGCGYKGLLGNAWNAGTCCLRYSNIDDVGLARLIVSNLQSAFRVNSSKIVTTGFSNGGMFSETLGCTSGDLFKAVASVGGTNVLEPGNAQGLAACDAAAAKNKDRPHVLIVHGDDDPTVPWAGNNLLGFPAIPDDLNAWKARTGCTGTPSVTIKTNNFKNEIYSCSNGKQVELVRHINGKHIWPRDNEFDVSRYIIEFFDRTVHFR